MGLGFRPFDEVLSTLDLFGSRCFACSIWMDLVLDLDWPFSRKIKTTTIWRAPCGLNPAINGYMDVTPWIWVCKNGDASGRLLWSLVLGQDPTLRLTWTLDLGLGFGSKLNLDLGLSSMLVYGLDKKYLRCLVRDLESGSLVLVCEILFINMALF